MVSFMGRFYLNISVWRQDLLTIGAYKFERFARRPPKHGKRYEAQVVSLSWLRYEYLAEVKIVKKETIVARARRLYESTSEAVSAAIASPLSGASGQTAAATDASSDIYDIYPSSRPGSTTRNPMREGVEMSRTEKQRSMFFGRLSGGGGDAPAADEAVSRSSVEWGSSAAARRESFVGMENPLHALARQKSLAASSRASAATATAANDDCGDSPGPDDSPDDDDEEEEEGEGSRGSSAGASLRGIFGLARKTSSRLVDGQAADEIVVERRKKAVTPFQKRSHKNVRRSFAEMVDFFEESNAARNAEVSIRRVAEVGEVGQSAAEDDGRDRESVERLSRLMRMTSKKVDLFDKSSSSSRRRQMESRKL